MIRSPFVEHPAGLIDRRPRSRPLEYVHSDHDHLARLQEPLGATGERTDLKSRQSHAPIRSHSAVSVGGDTTLDGQTYGTTFGIESAAADRVCDRDRTPPQRRE